MPCLHIYLPCQYALSFAGSLTFALLAQFYQHMCWGVAEGLFTFPTVYTLPNEAHWVKQEDVRF